MKYLLFVLLLLPCISFAQDNVYWNETYNVYHRDEKTILGYAKEFIEANKSRFFTGNIDSAIEFKYDQKENEIIVKAYTFIRQGSGGCFGVLYISGDIAFMAKDGRTRVEYRDIKYHIRRPAKTKCADDGTLRELKYNRCCAAFGNTESTIYALFNGVTDRYKSFLVKKHNDNNW